MSARVCRPTTTSKELAARIKATYAEYYRAAGNERLSTEVLGLMARLEQVSQARYAGGLAGQSDAIRAQLEQTAIQRVGFKYRGAGRQVYPGLLQLQSFMSMNAERHSKAFSEQILRVARGEASDHDAHNRFYDEYLAVMDMTAEFYLSTVERIFKNREIAKNEFTVAGKKVDIGAITQVAVKTVEGANDDISAPGQCVAALDLCTGLSADKKANHLEPGAGHYGIFAGKSWRLNIRPLVLNFIDSNSGAPKGKPKISLAASQ